MNFRSTTSRIDFGFGAGITPAVRMLLMINVAAFVVKILAEAAGYGMWMRLGYLIPYAVIHGFYLWQPVTYMFLHEGFFHILFNMFALWMFGTELERNWGTRRFFNYYFLCGIGSALVVILVNPSSLAGTLGASGAIYGLLLAYGMLFPDRMIFLYMIIPIRAKYFVIIMGAIEFLSAIATPGSLVSHTAHLGGMIFGLLYLRGRLYYWDVRNIFFRWRRDKLKRDFQVYMKKHDRDDEPRGPWVQ